MMPPPPPPPPPPPEPASDGDTYDAQNFSFAKLKPAVEEAAEATAAAQVEDDFDEEKDDSSDGFEFAFAVRDPDDIPPSTTADELFSGGRLLPACPVFNGDLIFSSFDAEASAEVADKVEERVSLRRLFEEEGVKFLPSSPSTEEVVGEYCEWTPRSAPQSPERWKKSASTGMVPPSASSSRRWRLRDLVVGRSHSDGKEKFVFIGSTPQPRPAAPLEERGKSEKEGEAKGVGRRRSSVEMDMGSAHRLYYGKGGGAAGQGGEGGGRRSFLPYRQELLGLFTNVNGLSWPHHHE